MGRGASSAGPIFGEAMLILEAGEWRAAGAVTAYCLPITACCLQIAVYCFLINAYPLQLTPPSGSSAAGVLLGGLRARVRRQPNRRSAVLPEPPRNAGWLSGPDFQRSDQGRQVEA